MDRVPSGCMVELYSPMRANQLLKHNIDTLLRVRHQTRKDLAQWCRKSESWISKIYKETRRGFSLRDFDRIAEFFGIATYQLFQPGISTLTERRENPERRTTKDRRVGHTARFMMETAREIDGKHPRRRADVASSPAQSPAVTRLIAIFEREIAAAVSAAAQSGDETPTPRRKVAGAPRSHRNIGGPDAGKA